MIKKTCYLLLILLCKFSFAETAIPDFTALIIDESRTLSTQQLDEINQTLLQFNNSEHGGAQVAVLMIPSLNNQSIENYAVKVFEKWQIGSAEYDNGVLLVISKADHKLRIEVGYGLEGRLTDAASGSIIRNNITPYFKKGDYYNGIKFGVNKIIKYISEENYQPYENEISNEDNINTFITYNTFVITYSIYALISLFICFRITKKIKNIIGHSFAAGFLNTFSGGLFSLLVYYGFLAPIIDFEILLCLIMFTTFVGSVFICGVFNPPPRSGGSSGGGSSGGGFSGGGFSGGGGSGGGFSGGGGGSSGGGGASGSW